MKLLLEELCAAAGVKVQLHTRVAAAYREGRRLTTIVTESKSGRQAWRAPVFIDATGDGDLGALAGCELEIGEAKECPCQPMSMYALLVVKDRGADRRTSSTAPSRAASRTAEARFPRRDPARGRHALLQACRRCSPSATISLLAMMNHEYGIKRLRCRASHRGDDARPRARCTASSAACANSAAPGTACKSPPHPSRSASAMAAASAGRYVVNKDDLVTGARHDDAVVRATFPVDIHALTAEDNKTARLQQRRREDEALRHPAARAHRHATWTAS